MPSTCWEAQNGRMLTEIAMWVRQASSGAADMYDEYEADKDILRKALRDWQPSIAEWCEKVDDAVYSLVNAVLIEVYWADKKFRSRNARTIPVGYCKYCWRGLVSPVEDDCGRH